MPLVEYKLLLIPLLFFSHVRFEFMEYLNKFLILHCVSYIKGMREKVRLALNGLLCVYKPADLSLTGLKKSILKRICSQGNAATGWPALPSIDMPVVEEHEKTGALIVTGKNKQLDYSQHPLVIGETFRSEDVLLEELHPIETTSSGICVFGVNNGVDRLDEIRKEQWESQWRIEAILGRETHKHEIKGKVIRREAYDHISKQNVMKLLAKARADYRRMAFEMAEVDLESSKAFSLASKGVPRPKLPGSQLVVSLKLLLFKLPYLAIVVDTVGETDAWLRCMVNEIGTGLGSTASPVRLIRRSIGPFRSEHCLLERQLSLQNIIDNIALCDKVQKEYNYDPDVVLESVKNLTEEGFANRKEILDRMVMNELSSDEFDALRPAWPRDYV